MKKVLFCFTLLTCLGLIACNNSNESSNTLIELQTPIINQQSYNSVTNTITWSPVENCNGYALKIDESEITTQTTNYHIDFSESKDFTFAIKALGKSPYTSDSPWSKKYTWHFELNTSTNVGASIYLDAGVGRSVDVVTALNYNDFKKGSTILDSQKLTDNLFSKKINNSGNVTSNSYKNIEDVYNKGSLSLELNISSDLTISAFIQNYSMNLKANSEIEYKNIKDSYYFILDHSINRYTVSLSNYSKEGYFSNYLSNDYLTTLSGLDNNPTLDNFYKFFNKYGTHLIVSGIFGGRLNAYYTIVNKTNLFTTNDRIFLDNILKVSTSATNDKSDLLLDIQNYFSQNAQTIESNLTLNSLGGNSVGATSLDDLGVSYLNWVNAFNNDSTNSVLIGYENDGLIPLWDLLPDKFSSLKESMINAFGEYYEENYLNYIKKFSYNNTVDYAGGSGTPNDPYLISDGIHLKNIELNMNSNFKLIDDIDLSEYEDWVAIGGYYNDNEKLFNGVLDGDNKKISNLKRTSDILEQNNRIYYGLFGRIGKSGIVKNIIFDEVNIAATGPAVNNSSTRVFFGTVAGALYGTIKNIKVISGKVSYDCCTNGCAYVGSMVGAAIDATITDCENYASITGGRYGGVAGGIAGYAFSTRFYNCINNGYISALCTGYGGAAYAGGIVGERSEFGECVYYNCANNGNLSAEPYSIPLLFGWNSNTGDLEANIVADSFE